MTPNRNPNTSSGMINNTNYYGNNNNNNISYNTVR